MESTKGYTELQDVEFTAVFTSENSHIFSVIDSNQDKTDRVETDPKSTLRTVSDSAAEPDFKPVDIMENVYAA